MKFTLIFILSVFSLIVYPQIAANSYRITPVLPVPTYSWPFNGDTIEVIQGNDAINYGAVLSTDKISRPICSYEFVSAQTDWMDLVSPIDLGTVHTIYYRMSKPGNYIVLHDADSYILQISNTTVVYRNDGATSDVQWATNITPGAYFDLAFVRNGLSVSLYINGEKFGNTETLVNNSVFDFTALTRNTSFIFDGKIDFIHLYDYILTDEEIRKIYLKEFSKPIVQPQFFVYGDSYAASFGVVEDSSKFFNRIAAEYNFISTANGVSGSTLQDTNWSPYGSLYASHSTLIEEKETNYDKSIIWIGTNDIGFNTPLYDTSLYRIQYDSILDYMFSIGWTKEDIIVLTPTGCRQLGRDTYIAFDSVDVAPSIQRFEDYVDKTIEVCSNKGVDFIDLYSIWDTVNYTGVDGLHPNDDGNVFLSDTLIEYIDYMNTR